MQFGWVNMSAYNFFWLWTKVHHLFQPTWEGVVEKFRDVTPTSPKVIGAHTLNFKPNFTCSPLNYFVVCASKPWSISMRVKI